jgi:hypothetical protein
MRSVDAKLLHWVMVHGKGDVGYDMLDDYWHKVRQELMSRGYVERFDLYVLDRPMYYLTSTGLFRLNQLHEAEERRIKRLKLKLKE